MKVAVVGHIEWGIFAHVDHVPVAGEIIHVQDSWQEAAGGGSVAAMQLAALQGSCLFYTAVGDDEIGQKAIAQLQKNHVEVYATVHKDVPTNTAFVAVDGNGERTITVTGAIEPSGKANELPWDKLADMDAVYFVSGDVAALQHARQAQVLVSTARTLSTLQQGHIQVDALVHSVKDGNEMYRLGDLLPAPKLVIATNGVHGGRTNSGITYAAEVVSPERLVDTYGCGDSFAAGLTSALGSGQDTTEALKTAAHTGAIAATRRGAFGLG